MFKTGCSNYVLYFFFHTHFLLSEILDACPKDSNLCAAPSVEVRTITKLRPVLKINSGVLVIRPKGKFSHKFSPLHKSPKTILI